MDLGLFKIKAPWPQASLKLRVQIEVPVKKQKKTNEFTGFCETETPTREA